ncbi:MAG: hypothetical protein FJ315_00795 [SAR202 cluster bacterium]|nr:hypothetical protein [SAR202 cluster bacterium]
MGGLIGRQAVSMSGGALGAVFGIIVGVMAGEVARLLFRTLDKSIIGFILGLLVALAAALIFGFLLARLSRVITGGLKGDPADIRNATILAVVIGAGGAMLFGSFFV